MDLRKLATEEQSQVSESWVKAGSPARAAIEKDTMLAPLLPKLEAAHAGVVAVSAQSPDPELRQLSALGMQLDAQHDDWVHAIYDALTLVAQVSKSGSDLVRLRDQLFPDGLIHINKTHRAQAGHAAAIASTMTDEIRARMKAIALGDATVLDMYDQWQSVSKQLGAVEEKLAHLSQPTTTLGAQTKAARREWIRWAKVLTTTAENTGVTPETDTLLFAPLRAAAQKADARWHSRPAPTPAPAPAT